MTKSDMSRLSNRYHEWVRRHPDAASTFREEIENLLNDAGIIFDRVSARIKGWPSFKAKAKKKDAQQEPVYPDPWKDIHDLIGVRIMVFHSTDIPQAIDVLGESFNVLRSVDKAAETRISGGFGYGSHHLVLQVTDAMDELEAYAGTIFEVQLRTVLQHAWAEFEHDIRYKQGPQPLDPQVDRLFTLAAGLIELADQQFDEIAALKDPHTDASSDVTLTADTLPGVLVVLLGDRFPRSRVEHHRWLMELLDSHGITTMSQLEELLDEGAIAFVHSAMSYRFRPGQVRLIDDLLLSRYGKKHIELTGESGNRSDRPRRLAKRLKALKAMRNLQNSDSGTSPSADAPSS